MNGPSVSRLLNYIYPWASTNHILGSFNPGVQPRGTPITAEVVRGGDVDINVMWRDARGRTVTGSWSKLSGWDLPINGSLPLDGQDWVMIEEYSRWIAFLFYFGYSRFALINLTFRKSVRKHPSDHPRVLFRVKTSHTTNTQHIHSTSCVLLDLRATPLRIRKLHLGDTTPRFDLWLTLQAHFPTTITR